jgi:hypothetical protein
MSLYGPEELDRISGQPAKPAAIPITDLTPKVCKTPG